ncbi:carbamoyltransferase C-terminal domain-containing protein [Streptomyces sp. NPDC049813]|uniref:carbamoyltransferase C-terminal domain-containing protein n=1 Tax=Streptomyces sp. NPDC049813 TaxID=3365597 RepID=UPI0037AF429E
MALGRQQMKVLGVSKQQTLGGQRIRNGGSALYVDGEIFALSEDKAQGRKYACGYEESLSALLRHTGLDLDRDIDIVAVSTCCEPETAALKGHPLEAHPKLVSVNHHFSHAALAFHASGYDRSLVVINDAGGNTLSGPEVTARWWEHPREQASYYLADKRSGIRLIDRDFDKPFDVGLGEMYRAFTHYLGWTSSVYSSYTMALAGHGDRDAVPAELFSFDGHHLSAPIRNDPGDPIGMITRLGRALGVNFGEPRSPKGAILRIHRDLAAFIQRSIEDALRKKLTVLAKKHGVDRVCLAGGTALNVVANGTLLEVFPGGVYVPSAPGDDGQCLGNVYAALTADGNRGFAVPSINTSLDACVGPGDKIDSAAVAGTLKKCGLTSYVVFETADFSDIAAKFLAAGSVVCVFQRQSEFGPRALGARSILADPRRADVVHELNALKRRDWFMPFAPAALASHMQDWFAPVASSPFMSFALQATPRALQQIPAVVNADGTARVQTVEDGENSPLSRTLYSFYGMTGIPVLLNTSFNHGGSPIVQTMEQAVDSFSSMPVNVLVLGRFIVVKSLSPAPSDLPLEGSFDDLSMQVFRAGSPTAVDVSVPSVRSVIRQLQDYTESVVFVRTQFPLYGQYLDWMRQGQKHTTIRFRRDAVEIPFSKRLPLFETSDYGPGDRTHPAEHVQINGVRYHRFGELTLEDAEKDGFRDVAHMRHDLKTIYPTMQDNDWVTVYDIELADRS